MYNFCDDFWITICGKIVNGSVFCHRVGKKNGEAVFLIGAVEHGIYKEYKANANDIMFHRHYNA